MCVRFPFNDRKTAQAAAYLLHLAGGELNYMQLIKLMYLADRQMLLEHGLPITGDRMVSMKHGPVLSRILDFINEGDGPNNPSAWFEYIGPAKNYSVALLKDPGTDELSKFELGLLKNIYETYGRMDKWKLVRMLHEILPEWKDPGSSMHPIEPEDILRAASRSEAEIREIQDAADDFRFLSTSSTR